jgi:hypothetical protein
MTATAAMIGRSMSTGPATVVGSLGSGLGDGAVVGASVGLGLGVGEGEAVGSGVGQATGPMELVGRLPLDGRRAIYLVRVGERVFIVGASEAGLSKLGDVPGDSLPAASDPRAPGPSFTAALAQVLGRSAESGDRGDVRGSGGA